MPPRSSQSDQGNASIRDRGRAPVRTCLGCRSRAAQSELLRLVAVGGALTPDPGRRLPGRGAYIHPRPRCWAAAQRRRAWAKGLRVAGDLDTAPVTAYVEAGTHASLPLRPSGEGHPAPPG